jgi:heme exporter protein B
MSLMGESRLVAGKDLRIEVRSRVTLHQVLPFAGIVLLLFAFALDPDRGLLPRVAPGLFWVAVLLASLMAVARASAVESQHAARDGLRLSGLDPAAIFLGKSAAVAVQLAALEVLLAAGLLLFYDVEARGMGQVTLATGAATVGLAAAGTLYGVLVAGLRVRETLLPLVLLPVLGPVMVAGTRAWEEALAGTPSQAWPWIEVLVVFAAVYLVMGVLAYGPLLEEA